MIHVVIKLTIWYVVMYNVRKINVFCLHLANTMDWLFRTVVVFVVFWLYVSITIIIPPNDNTFLVEVLICISVILVFKDKSYSSQQVTLYPVVDMVCFKVVKRIVLCLGTSVHITYYLVITILVLAGLAMGWLIILNVAIFPIPMVVIHVYIVMIFDVEDLINVIHEGILMVVVSMTCIYNHLNHGYRTVLLFHSILEDPVNHHIPEDLVILVILLILAILDCRGWYRIDLNLSQIV